jgi:hypothetical protein
MKKLLVLCIVLFVGASTTAAFARGGMGGHGMGSHMSMTGMSMTGAPPAPPLPRPAPTRRAQRFRQMAWAAP